MNLFDHHVVYQICIKKRKIIKKKGLLKEQADVFIYSSFGYICGHTQHSFFKKKATTCACVNNMYVITFCDVTYIFITDR